MKKKMITVLALALALSLLTGCEMFVPDPTQRPSHWWESAEPTGSADPSPSQTGWQEGVGPDYDRRFSRYGEDDICATEDTLYFSAYATMGANAYRLIYYVDKATGICLPVCGKPECTHSDESCNAYAPNSTVDGLSSYNGRLYWVGQYGHWMTGGVHWNICSMAYDGTDRRTVRELPDDWKDGSQTQIHRGYLYNTYLTEEVVDGKAKEAVYLVAVPLEGDGEPLVILRAENVYGNWLAIQAYEEYVYIAFEAEDGAFELHRWDTRVGELETLYRGETPIDWEYDFWVMEDGVVIGSREYTETDGGWEWYWDLYLFSFETRRIELLNRIWINEANHRNNNSIDLLDGLVIAMWTSDSGGIRVLVKDFEGRTVLDAAFEGVDWILMPFMSLVGVDEDYLYFTIAWAQYISVSRDGGEIRLMWERESR